MEAGKNSWFLSRVPDDVPRSSFPSCSISWKGEAERKGRETEAEMVLLPRNLGTIAVERISGIEPWPRHASRIPLNSFLRFTIRFIPSRDHDKEGMDEGSSRCDDRHILSPMGVLLFPPRDLLSRPSMIFPIRDIFFFKRFFVSSILANWVEL